jgi:hypothetical protein
VNTRNYFHLGDRFGFFVDSVSERIELQKGKIGKFLLCIFFSKKILKSSQSWDQQESWFLH